MVFPVLKVGSRGPAVRAAKMGVDKWRGKSGNTSPFYGIFFRPLVKNFQKEKGISQTGVIGPRTWKALKPYLTKAALELLDPKPAIPNLGPVMVGGQSVLLQDCTHATSGIPLYPAFDSCFRQGIDVIAPENMEVTRSSSSRPGLAFYAAGDSSLMYWFGHLDRTHSPGKVFRKGQVVGKVAPNSIGGGPHVHVGVNAEAILGPGKEFAHHTNYTHGAATIGAQLAAHAA